MLSLTARIRAMRLAWMFSVALVFGLFSSLYLMQKSEPAGIVILDQLGPGYRGYWILTIAMLAALALSIWLRRWVLSARQRKNEIAAAQLLASLRAGKPSEFKDFFVYLRSFETSGHLKPPFFFTMAVLQSLHTNELESFLTLALAKNGPVVALGLPGQSVGAAHILVDDASWKEDIQRLLSHASAFLVIPSSHEGTKWEIEYLKAQNLLSKAIFIMPPKSRQFDWPLRWQQAAQALEASSIFLPEYCERGLLFTLNSEGQVDGARGMPLAYLRSLRKSVETMLTAPSRAEVPNSTDIARGAVRRSRIFWFLRKWTALVSLLLSVAIAVRFGIEGMWLGHAPRGGSPPPWSMFFLRYDSATEIGTGQSLLDSELLFLRRRASTESEIDLLARHGLTRVSVEDREIYLLGFGEMLTFSPNERVCAALAQGRASEIERTRVLVQMSSPHINLWMPAREKAALALARNRPAAFSAAAVSPRLNEAVSAVLSAPAASHLEGLLAAPHKLDGVEACMFAIQSGTALYRLQEPYRGELATLVAQYPD